MKTKTSKKYAYILLIKLKLIFLRIKAEKIVYIVDKYVTQCNYTGKNVTLKVVFFIETNAYLKQDMSPYYFSCFVFFASLYL